ncbi:MAG: hypothetical protein NTZ33_06140 [Bacteroidetes bacterium]|nr:hypothetical protein [Bacteroidota bacterium]
MWTEIFKERIRIEKIEHKTIIKLIGISEAAFYKGFKTDSFKFQNILKVYKHYGWDLNELKIEDANTLKKLKTTAKQTEQNESQKESNLIQLMEDQVSNLGSHIDRLKAALDLNGGNKNKNSKNEKAENS